MADLETRIRITAQLGQSLTELRKLKRELDELDKAQGTAPQSPAGPNQAIVAKRAEAEERKRLAKEAAAAEKKAAADALAAQRAAANQARMLGPQITDIFVGLTTGQSPLMVLLQQGGQLKDMFGGVGAALKALGSIFTVTRVAIGGVAAAIGTVAFAAYQGARDSDALNKSLALTGNIAGTSAGQLDTMAKSIAAQQKAAIGDVRETLASAVGTGQFTSTSLESAGRAATALSKLTGKTAADTIQQFDGMADGVAEWSAKTNRAYNFLTADQYKYIQSLEAQGRTQEAMKVALDALAGTMEQRSIPAVGLLERSWNTVKSTLSGVLDTLKDIGRDTTPEERIEKLIKLRKNAADLGEIAARNRGQQATPAASPELASIDAQIEAEQRLANMDKVRAAERTIAQQTENDKILKASKAYQDQLAQVTAAGSQITLANTLAALDKQQAALDQAHARGVQSEKDYALARNRIDVQRLQAQEAALTRQIAIESGKTIEKPQDALARDAAVKGLQAQLIQIRGQVAQAASQAQVITSQAALDDARDKAQEWAQLWQQAFGQIRQLAQQNNETAAAGIADPVGRASAQAAIAVGEVRRQVDELRQALELRLSLTLDPGTRATIQQQLADLAAQSGKAIDEATRKSLFGSYAAQLSELEQALQAKEDAINQRVAAGQQLQADGEAEILALRRAQIPELERILQLLAAQASTPAEQNQVATERNRVTALKDLRTEVEKTARSSAISELAQGLTDIQTGAKTTGEALRDMVGGFAKTMLNVLNQKLAEQLVNQFAEAVGGGSGGGGFGGFLSGIGKFVAGLFHTGGVVGGPAPMSRQVDPAAFALAPRYHSGGIAGLRPNEVPAVLNRGEEVLTADDPRHRNNGGGAGGLTFNSSIVLNGSDAGTADQAAQAQELERRVRAVVIGYVADQRRQGGVFAGI